LHPVLKNKKVQEKSPGRPQETIQNLTQKQNCYLIFPLKPKTSSNQPKKNSSTHQRRINPKKRTKTQQKEDTESTNEETLTRRPAGFSNLQRNKTNPKPKTIKTEESETQQILTEV
jgi:hypothetical protein